MMILIIQNPDLKKVKNENIIYLDSICNLKYVKEEIEVLVLNGIEVDENGIINIYNFFLEEVMITKNIKIIIANKGNEKLKEICDFYKLSLIEM